MRLVRVWFQVLVLMGVGLLSVKSLAAPGKFTPVGEGFRAWLMDDIDHEACIDSPGIFSFLASIGVSKSRLEDLQKRWTENPVEVPLLQGISQLLPGYFPLFCGGELDRILGDSNAAVCVAGVDAGEGFAESYQTQLVATGDDERLSCPGRVEVRLKSCPDLRNWDLSWLDDADEGVVLNCGAENTTRWVPWYHRQASPRVGVGESLLQGFALTPEELFPAPRPERPVVLAASGGPGSEHYLMGVLLALDWMALEDSPSLLHRVGAIVTTSTSGLAAAQAVDAQLAQVRLAGEVWGEGAPFTPDISYYRGLYRALERQYHYPSNISVAVNTTGSLFQKPKYPLLTRSRRLNNRLLLANNVVDLDLNPFDIREMTQAEDVPLWIPVAMDLSGVSTFPVTETSLAARAPCWMPTPDRAWGRVNARMDETVTYEDWIAEFDVGLLASVSTAEDPLSNPVVLSTGCTRQPARFNHRQRRSLDKANRRLAPAGVPLVLLDGKQVDPYALRTASALTAAWSREGLGDDAVLVRISTHPLSEGERTIDAEWLAWEHDYADDPVLPSKISTHRWLRSLRAMASFGEQGAPDLDLSYYSASEAYHAAADAIVRYAYHLSEEEPALSMHVRSDEYRLKGWDRGRSIGATYFKRLKGEAKSYATAWTLHGMLAVAMAPSETLVTLTGQQDVDVDALRHGVVCGLMQPVMTKGDPMRGLMKAEVPAFDTIADAVGVSCEAGQ